MIVAYVDYAGYEVIECTVLADMEKQLVQGFDDRATCIIAGCQTCQQRPEMPCSWTCCMGWAIWQRLHPS